MRQITPINKVREIYSDLRKDLFLNPMSDCQNRDLVRKTNEEAVKESMRNLILIDKGERLMQPNLGADVRRLLFENYTVASIKVANQLILSTLTTFEPRADVIDVSITFIEESHRANINILFAIRLVEDPISFDIMITRSR